MPRLCTRFPAALATLHAFCHALALFVPGAAHAYADQASLDLAAGYVHVDAVTPLPSAGADLTVGGSYGLGDMFLLRAHVGYGLQAARSRQVSVVGARTEIVYLLDVVSVVPFFGVGAGVWVYDARGAQLAPIGHGITGADWLLTREWTLGVDLRFGLLLASREVSPLFASQLRCSRVFDLF